MYQNEGLYHISKGMAKWWRLASHLGFFSYCPFFRVFPLASGVDHMTKGDKGDRVQKKKNKKDFNNNNNNILFDGAATLLDRRTWSPWAFLLLSSLQFSPLLFLLFSLRRTREWKEFEKSEDMEKWRTNGGWQGGSCIYEPMCLCMTISPTKHENTYECTEYICIYLKMKRACITTWVLDVLLKPWWSPKR